MVKKYINQLSSTAIMVGSFVLLIFIGAIILSFPISSEHKTSFIDALFTATSSVCVTGLTVVPTYAHWTFFGKIVLLFLIQIGGLGLMTYYMFFAIISKKKISLKDRMVVQESFHKEYFTGTIGLIIQIFKVTIIIESIGGFFLFLFFLSRGHGFLQSLWFGIFHAITAFNNSGMDILGDNSLMEYNQWYGFMFVIRMLITLGGIGFSTIGNIVDAIKTRKNSHWLQRKKLSLNTKIVLIMTIGTFIVGSLFFFVIEYNNPATFYGLSLKEKINAALFHTTTLHTAGFYSIDVNGLTYASKLMSIFIMFIGGSPGGTAGGIKTVTFAVIILSIVAIIKGRDEIVVCNKRIPQKQLRKALIVFVLHLGIVLFASMLLTITERETLIEYEFIDILFETVSATATVGISVGFTPLLSTLGKMIVSFCMFMGRIGPLTVVVLLSAHTKESLLSYPTENVMIG